jgi:hypothetical protein
LTGLVEVISDPSVLEGWAGAIVAGFRKVCAECRRWTFRRRYRRRRRSRRTFRSGGWAACRGAAVDVGRGRGRPRRRGKATEPDGGRRANERRPECRDAEARDRTVALGGRESLR